MKTTTQPTNEAAAPASVRPSVSKNNTLPRLDFARRHANRQLSTKAVVTLLRHEAPQVLNRTQIVGQWVWIHFNERQPKAVTANLSQLGFHWNKTRQAWQHPCGAFCTHSADYDPRSRYGVQPVAPDNYEGLALKEEAPTLPDLVKPFRFAAQPCEYKVTALRECPTPMELQQCDTPQAAADYWRLHIPTHPYFNPDCECLVALILNTRRRVKGHYLISMGTMDTILVSPLAVFRLAVMASAAAVVLVHNHPSGDPTPSEGDIKVTRDLIRAGQLLKIEVLDHVVMGRPNHSSLRELGYFA